MPDKYLHVVSFDIPDPPNYGGVIDVYYKLKTLHKKGIRIILHAFEYPGRDRSDNLLNYCQVVHYYPRLLGFKSAVSGKPYIVSSRKSEQLLENLCRDDHPILFEGLHSCYYLGHPRLENRFKIYRESNIEHRYYFNLFKIKPDYYVYKLPKDRLPQYFQTADFFRHQCTGPRFGDGLLFSHLRLCLARDELRPFSYPCRPSVPGELPP